VNRALFVFKLGNKVAAPAFSSSFFPLTRKTNSSFRSRAFFPPSRWRWRFSFSLLEPPEGRLRMYSVPLFRPPHHFSTIFSRLLFSLPGAGVDLPLPFPSREGFIQPILSPLFLYDTAASFPPLLWAGRQKDFSPPPLPQTQLTKCIFSLYPSPPQILALLFPRFFLFRTDEEISLFSFFFSFPLPFFRTRTDLFVAEKFPIPLSIPFVREWILSRLSLPVRRDDRRRVGAPFLAFLAIARLSSLSSPLPS